MPTRQAKVRRVRKFRPKAQVSFNMSRIRSTGSKIEQLMETALLEQKLRPRKHFNVFGKPDFAFPRERVAVFCDSHFWHGYKWKEKKKELRRNKSFWISKITANIDRDRVVNRQLVGEGWQVIRFWEHQIIRAPRKCAETVLKATKIRKAKS